MKKGELAELRRRNRELDLKLWLAKSLMRGLLAKVKLRREDFEERQLLIETELMLSNDDYGVAK